MNHSLLISHMPKSEPYEVPTKFTGRPGPSSASARETMSRAVAAVPTYRRNLPLGCRKHRRASSSYFACMTGAWASNAWTSSGSLKLPVISIPVSSMVPFQNVSYSSGLSKQKISPGLRGGPW